jgi:anaerobic selenocysteine-containing dehydrogenase
MLQTLTAATCIPTTCWECSTCCGAIAHVESGRVTRIDPNPGHPASRGAFCVKGIRGLSEITYGKTRLLHPLRRIGERGSNRWEEISWDAALDAMAEGFAAARAKHGPLALAGAVGGAFFSRGPIVALLMRAMGSPNFLINQDLCGGCRGVSDMVTGLAIQGGEDVEHANTVLMVGANPHAANPVQWARIKEAKSRGAKIVVLDPLRSEAAKIADLWLRPLPGTDAAIALAMMHVLIAENRHAAAFIAQWTHGFEQLAERVSGWTPERAAEASGVPAELVLAAARAYANGPSAFVSGHGIDAVTNGVQTFRAFHCLVAISGNLDRLGGNRRAKRPTGFRNYLDVIHDPAFQLAPGVAAKTLGADRFPLWAGPRGWQAACHNPTVIEAIFTGKPYPVRAMYVSGVNIAVTYPDSQRTIAALRSLDFLAVAAHSMNPTAALADIVLPKTTTLEEEDVSINAHGPCVTWTGAVAERCGEARPDIEIAAGLIERMAARGTADSALMPWRTQREFNAFLLKDTGLSIEALARDGYAEFGHALGNFEAQVFKTPSGKVELWSQRMADTGLDPLPDFVPTGASRENDPAYPFTLQTGLREKTYHHSRFREQAWARKVSPDPLLKMHPETAQSLGIFDGDWVSIETPRGRGACRVKASVTDATAPGILVTGMGWWLPEAAGPEFGVLDININAAISYAGPYDPASGSADTRGVPCRVTRL